MKLSRRNNSLTFLIFILSLVSCINIKVSKKYINYNPYKKGHVLVFQSKVTNSFDTILIMNVREKRKERNLPYWIGHNTYHIYALPLNYYWGNLGEQRISNFLSIYPPKSIPENSLFMGITLNASFYAINNLKNIDSLMNQKEMSFQVNGKTYNDVLVFNLIPNFSKIKPAYIKQVYWSKKHGYIRLINYGNDTANIFNHYYNEDIISKYQNVRYY